MNNHMHRKAHDHLSMLGLKLTRFDKQALVDWTPKYSVHACMLSKLSILGQVMFFLWVIVYDSYEDEQKKIIKILHTEARTNATRRPVSWGIFP